MGSKWFNSAVVLMWMCTTTWLVVAKVIPPLRRGQPPSYRSMYAEDFPEGKTEETVGWDLTLNDKPLGWALSRVRKLNTRSSAGQMTEVKSLIHFDHIPLAELSPPWMRVLLRANVDSVDNLQMDVLSTLAIDPLGHLEGFRSSLSAPGMRDTIRIVGKVHATVLKIDVHSGDFNYPFETYLPSDALVSDELSPQSRMLGLHLGQEWTVPVFSALRPPNNPVDVLQAKVESHDLLMWEGAAVPVFEVVYRPDSGSALWSTGQPRAKLWVRDDGTVLKQEVSFIGSPLVFSRMSDERSKQKEIENPIEMRNRGGYGWRDSTRPARPVATQPDNEPSSPQPSDTPSEPAPETVKEDATP
jgi:hypothetical protein